MERCKIIYILRKKVTINKFVRSRSVFGFTFNQKKMIRCKKILHLQKIISPYKPDQR